MLETASTASSRSSRRRSSAMTDGEAGPRRAPARRRPRCRRRRAPRRPGGRRSGRAPRKPRRAAGPNDRVRGVGHVPDPEASRSGVDLPRVCADPRPRSAVQVGGSDDRRPRPPATSSASRDGGRVSSWSLTAGGGAVSAPSTSLTRPSTASGSGSAPCRIAPAVPAHLRHAGPLGFVGSGYTVTYASIRHNADRPPDQAMTPSWTPPGTASSPSASGAPRSPTSPGGPAVSRMTLYRRWPDVRTLVADLMTREWARRDRGGVRRRRRPGPRALIGRGLVRPARALRANPLFARIVDVDPEVLLPYLLDRRGHQPGAPCGAAVADRSAPGTADGSVRAGDLASRPGRCC